MADADKQSGGVTRAEAARWAVIALVVFGAGMVVGDMRSTLARHDSGLADVAKALEAQREIRASDRRDQDNLTHRVSALERMSGGGGK